MKFSTLYPLYVTKVERKGQSVDALNDVIRWLTGYSQAQLERFTDSELSLDEFFAGAPMNPNAELITGVICGVRVEQIEDPFMKKVRQLDKLVDEVAAGRALSKILRA